VSLSLTPPTAQALDLKVKGRLAAALDNFKQAASPVLDLSASVSAPVLSLSQPPMALATTGAAKGMSRAWSWVLALTFLTVLGGGGFYGYGAWQEKQAQALVAESGLELNEDGLLQALAQGRLDLLQAYDTLGIDAADVPRSIEAAVISGQPTVLTAVLDAGALLSNEPNAARLLVLAAATDDVALMQAVLALTPIQADQVGEVFNEVFKNGHGALFEPLSFAPEVQAYRDPNGFALVHFAALVSSNEVLGRMREAKVLDIQALANNGTTALHLMVGEDKPQTVEWLLNAGLDPLSADRSGNTALSMALDASDASTLAVMAKASEAVSRTLITEHALTVLEEGMTAVVDTLLERGWSPQATLSNGWTPLAVAASRNHTALMERLLSAGVPINATFVLNDVAGVTPLMLAAVNGHEEAVSILLNGGADRTMQASNGASAWALAERQGHAALVDRLR
jgi:ankyrin repeat protein